MAGYQYRRVRQRYDRLSGWYDLFAGWGERRPRRLGESILDLRAGERVLEVGCGTGNSLKALAGFVGSEQEVCAIDISLRTLDRCRAKMSHGGNQSRTCLACADARALPYPSGTFDALLMCFVLELFDDRNIARVLAECCRVLDTGGRACVVSLARLSPAGPVQRLYERLHARFPDTFDCRPIDLQSLLAASGLSVANTERIFLWGLPVEIVLATPAD